MLLELSEARALITTSLSDADLGDAIDREEAWLARRVGPLSGTRTETFITPDGDEVLQLARPAAVVSVTDEGGALAASAYALRGWADVVPADDTTWQSTVEVEYAADDESEVKRALITLVRLTVAESPHVSESQQGYSVTESMSYRRRMRWEAWRGLLRPATPASTRLRSSIPAGGNSVAGVGVVAAGS